MSESKKDFKTALSKLKEAAIAFKEAMTPQKFGKSVLADGTQLEWEGEEPMVGMPAMAIAADGTSAPAPDGEYTLPENGTVITIEGGNIATVTPAAAASDPNAPANPAANEGMSEATPMTPAQAKEITERIEKVSKFMEDAEVRFSNMEKLISDQAEVIAAQKKENEDLNTKLVTFSKQVTETLEQIGEEPQEKGKQEMNFRNENKPEETIQEWRKRMKLTK
jgi:hypothetical protein